MIVIPAIDLRGGKCVRLIQGDPKNETVYSDDPVSVAKQWQSKGAERLHVVDLDGAFSGKMQNFDIIKEIIKAIEIPVQVGGGIRDIETMDSLFKNRAGWVILGTSVWNNKELLQTAAKKYKGSIMVSIDTKNGMLAVSGWQKIINIKTIDLIKEIKSLGIGTIIYTDIVKDGMLEGPNFESIEKLLYMTNISIIASGGITAINDIKKLKEFESIGLEGVIVGKALYTGKVDLAKAIKAVS